MAVSLTVLELAAELRASDGTDDLIEPQLGIFTRLLEAVSQLVQDYAPEAPGAIQNEAAIRVGAWLYDSVPGRSQAERDGCQRRKRFGITLPYPAGLPGGVGKADVWFSKAQPRRKGGWTIYRCLGAVGNGKRDWRNGSGYRNGGGRVCRWICWAGVSQWPASNRQFRP